MSLTPQREKKLRNALDKRQAGLAVVLENVDDPHNIAAVMRTCESVGIQDLYVLTTRIHPHNRYGVRASSSASKWLTIHSFSDTKACVDQLRKQYRRIFTTHLAEDSVGLYKIDFTQSIALVFGNEHDGVTEEMLALADGNFVIPQVGIIESLNISVACAVSVYEAMRQREKAGLYDQPSLTAERREALLQEWSIPRRGERQENGVKN